MGATAAVMRSKRGSPLTRARVLSLVNPCKPPRLRKEFVIDQSGGDKEEACGWERMSLDEPDSRKGKGNSGRQTAAGGAAVQSKPTCDSVRERVALLSKMPSMATAQFKG